MRAPTRVPAHIYLFLVSCVCMRSFFSFSAKIFPLIWNPYTRKMHVHMRYALRGFIILYKTHEPWSS